MAYIKHEEENKAEKIIISDDKKEGKKNDIENFYQWMLNDQHMEEAICKDYVFAIQNLEIYALEHGLQKVNLSTSSSNELNKIVDMFFDDFEFLDKKEVQYNQFRMAIAKLFAYLDIKSFCAVLLKHFPKGYRLGSSIEMRKFRHYYEIFYGTEIQQNDKEAEEIIRQCGIEYRGRVYTAQTMMDEELKKQLFIYIEKSIAEGKILYFESLFRKFSEEFFNHHSNIYDADMLRIYISHIAGNKYFIGKNYISDKKGAFINPIDNVRICLKEYVLPMKVDNLCRILSHIPEEQIKKILHNYPEFVRNGESEYFHADSFAVSEEELENISLLLTEEIEEHEYITSNELYDIIKRKYPYIYERNISFSVIGWKDALKYKLGDRYSFNGNIISSKEKELSMSDVFSNYAKNQSGFSLQEVLDFAKSIGSSLTVYFDALYKNVARISHDQFVPEKSVTFQVKKTDEILDSFCTGTYIALSKVNNLGILPEASHPWTPFLLEYYVEHHSEHYYLMHSGYNINMVVGAMVKKSKSYSSFTSLLIDILVESGVTLQKKDALNYLFDNGYIACRSYTKIETILISARAKRNKKEN